MSLFFAQHGRTSGSESRMISSDHEPLSDAGRSDARLIGRNLLELLGERKLHYMMVSPTVRTLETGRLVLATLPYANFVQQVVEDRLAPRAMGTYVETLANKVPWHDETALVQNGVESQQDLQDRHNDLAQHIRDEWSTMNGLLVGHSSSIRPLAFIANLPTESVARGELLMLEP
jgi:broad specificity phosphatase PhoE